MCTSIINPIYLDHRIFFVFRPFNRTIKLTRIFRPTKLQTIYAYLKILSEHLKRVKIPPKSY